MNGNFSESLQLFAYLLQVVLAITGDPPSSYWVKINLCSPNEFLTHTLNQAGGNGSRVSLLGNSKTTSTKKQTLTHDVLSFEDVKSINFISIAS